MTIYEHKPLRRWFLLSLSLKMLIALLRYWFLIVLVVAALHPVSPHVLWRYTSINAGSNIMFYRSCEYIGMRGVVPYMKGRNCPFFVLIDRREINYE